MWTVSFITVSALWTEKPGFLDFKGKAKWEAWNGKKGMSQVSAKEAYVTLANKLISTYGLKWTKFGNSDANAQMVIFSKTVENWVAISLKLPSI